MYIVHSLSSNEYLSNFKPFYTKVTLRSSLIVRLITIYAEWRPIISESAFWCRRNKMRMRTRRHRVTLSLRNYWATPPILSMEFIVDARFDFSHVCPALLTSPRHVNVYNAGLADNGLYEFLRKL